MVLRQAYIYSQSLTSLRIATGKSNITKQWRWPSVWSLLFYRISFGHEVGFGKVVRTLKEEEGLLDLYNRVGTTNTRRVGGRGRKRGGWASQARRGQKRGTENAAWSAILRRYITYRHLIAISLRVIKTPDLRQSERRHDLCIGLRLIMAQGSSDCAYIGTILWGNGRSCGPLLDVW